MRFSPVLILLLCACNTPTFGNLNAPSKNVTAQGLEFRVVYTLTEAEAYRLTPMWRPDMSQIMPASLEAIELASGCQVNRNRVQGDPAKVVAELVC